MRLGLCLADRHARRVLLGPYHLPKLRQLRCPLDRSERQPSLDDLGMPDSRLGTPPSVRVGNRVQELTVEALIPALVGDIFLGRTGRQVDQPLDRLLDFSARAERVQRLMPSRADLQILYG